MNQRRQRNSFPHVRRVYHTRREKKKTQPAASRRATRITKLLNTKKYISVIN